MYHIVETLDGLGKLLD